MNIIVKGFTSANDLLKEIIQYDFWHALERIGNLSIQIFKNKNQIQDKTLNPWTLSRIAYYFMKYGSIFGNKKMQDGDLVRIKDMIINLYDPIVQENNVWQFYARSTREQFSYQYGHAEQTARYIRIFTQNRFLEEMKQKFEVLNKFDLRTYYQIFFYVLGHTMNTTSSHFEYQSLLDYCVKEESKYSFLEVQKIESFFSFISNSLDNIKKEGERINTDLKDKYLKYELSPLDVYPVINQFLGKKHCFMPSLESLQTKTSTGLYYYFQNLYGQGGKKNPFLTQVGYAFEEYIGWLLKNYFEEKNVKKVSSVIQTDGQEHADWVVFIDDEIFIFECKARLLSLRGRQTYEAKFVKPFLTDTVIKGCKQLLNTKTQLKKLYSKKNITKIFVILDDFYFRKNIFDGLLQNSSLETENIDDVIMTTARGIERVGAVLEEKTMKQICDLKQSSEEHQKSDFLNFLHNLADKNKLENKYLTRILDDLINIR